MRKVELVYLHALLAQVHDHLAEHHDVQDSFEEYDAGTGPYQVQRRKAEHEAAARLLADRLAEEVSSASRASEQVSNADEDAGPDRGPELLEA